MQKSVIAQFMEEGAPFNRLLGMQFSDCGEGWAELRIPYRPEFIGDPSRPALHGGVISTLLDTAGGAAAMTGIDMGDRLSTIDLRVDFLRPGEPKEVVVRADVLRQGNRVIVTAAKAHQGDPQQPIAEGRAVYNLRRSES